MSLFSNLFGASAANGSSQLFGSDNKFRNAPVDTAALYAVAHSHADNDAQKGSRDASNVKSKSKRAGKHEKNPSADPKSKQKRNSTLQEQASIAIAAKQPDTAEHTAAESTEASKPNSTKRKRAKHVEHESKQQVGNKQARNNSNSSHAVLKQADAAKSAAAKARAAEHAAVAAPTSADVVKQKHANKKSKKGADGGEGSTKAREQKASKTKKRAAAAINRDNGDAAVPSSTAAATAATAAAGKRGATASSQAAMHVQNDDDDDDDKDDAPTTAADAAVLQRTLFVGNLPATIKRKTIKHLFSKYGQVETVRMRSATVASEKPMSRRAAVLSGAIDEAKPMNAYVVLSSQDAAAAALQLNMTEVEGRHIRVDMAAPPSHNDTAQHAQYDTQHTVFVGNLPYDVDTEDLISFFGGDRAPECEGAIEAVRVVRDRETGQGKGIAYVCFKHAAAVRAALSLHTAEFNGRQLRVSRCKRTMPSQDKQDGSRAAKMRNRSAAAWQGASVKGKSGKLRQAAATTAGGGGKQGALKKAMKRSGKRPSVAARKARQLQSKAAK